jgi:hypothetical protein
MGDAACQLCPRRLGPVAPRRRRQRRERTHNSSRHKQLPSSALTQQHILQKRKRNQVFFIAPRCENIKYKIFSTCTPVASSPRAGSGSSARPSRMRSVHSSAIVSGVASGIRRHQKEESTQMTGQSAARTRALRDTMSDHSSQNSLTSERHSQTLCHTIESTVNSSTSVTNCGPGYQSHTATCATHSRKYAVATRSQKTPAKQSSGMPSAAND